MKPKKFEIIGKDLSKEDKGVFSERVREKRIKSEERLEGELEKTELEIRMAGLINKYLEQELVGLNLEYEEVRLGQLHILSPESFEKHFPGLHSNAFYHSADDRIYIRKGTQANELEYFKQVFHEIIHLVSFHKFLIDKKADRTGTYRLGYANTDPRRESDTFRGLNEAVVDRIAMEAVFKNSTEIISVLGADKDKQTVTTWYPKQLEVLDIILKKIATISGENIEEVWKRFKFEEFHGDMMHLRDIEKTLGKGGLRIIALLPTGRSPDKLSLIKDIIGYLNIDDKESREKMAQQVLDKSLKNNQSEERRNQD
ncbi:MAG TPA: hypothetical protein VJH71_01790 [Candidatus Paceibacterota bacterium]